MEKKEAKKRSLNATALARRCAMLKDVYRLGTVYGGYTDVAKSYGITNKALVEMVALGILERVTNNATHGFRYTWAGEPNAALCKRVMYAERERYQQGKYHAQMKNKNERLKKRRRLISIGLVFIAGIVAGIAIGGIL